MQTFLTDEAIGSDEVADALAEFLGLEPTVIALALVVAVIVGLATYVWINGRDRWFGDMPESPAREPGRIRPLFAHETVVVRFEPPLLPAAQRRMRPAEVGLLMDERADTLDISATIADLAFRGYLSIEALPKRNLLSRRDYALTKLRPPHDVLLDYETCMLQELFGSNNQVRLSLLRGGFWSALVLVKSRVVDEALEQRLFDKAPETARMDAQLLGAGIAAAGVAAMVFIGVLGGVALMAAPIVLGGLALIALARLMPRRTALGRKLYRECLGFREYIVTAETDRQRFAEQENIFEEYLPYAMVFGCTKKWASAFEGLEAFGLAGNWYVGDTGFLPLDIGIGLEDFAGSMFDGGAFDGDAGDSGGDGG